MFRWMVVPVLGLALAGCGNQPKSGDGPMLAAKAADVFPKAGDYHIVRDSSGPGGQLERKESDMWIDASNREAFEELVARDDGSNCRDRQVEIGSGSFSVKLTCDAHDGDIHNISMERRGSYSADSIDMTTETSFWGMTIRETASYKLQ